MPSTEANTKVRINEKIVPSDNGPVEKSIVEIIASTSFPDYAVTFRYVVADFLCDGRYICLVPDLRLSPCHSVECRYSCDG